MVQVYNLSLHAALEAQGCGPRQLEVKGEWAWLLEEFAATYGIRSSYTVLAHLLWAIRYSPHICCRMKSLLIVSATCAKQCSCIYLSAGGRMPR